MSLLTVLFTLYLCNSEVLHLDETNFEDATSTGLWYLEFYAPWCGHCKKFAPVYEEASNDPALKDKIKFGAIDATSQKAIAKQFGVSRFPTIKFFEKGQEYKFSGARTLESLITQGSKMLEPVIKDLNTKIFNEFNNRYTVSFLYIINDENSNINIAQTRQIFQHVAMKFRPNIPFYAINYSQFKKLFFNKKKNFMDKSLKLNGKILENQFTMDGQSILFAVTPSIKNKELNGVSLGENEIEEFIEQNRYAPIMQLKLGNYKDLVDNTKYFGIVFAHGSDGKIDIKSNKLIDAGEKLAMDNKEWNMESFKIYREWKIENMDIKQDIYDGHKILMYKVLIAWCNFTEYEEWATHQFGIKEDELPVMLVYSPKEDGYWKYKNDIGSMSEFYNEIFEGNLEIIYTRNWIARQAVKLERWLNNLSGWQIALVFISVFVLLCGIMVLLDYCCSPTPSIKTD
eukprot:271193_1